MDHIGQAGIHTTGVDAATGTQRSAHVPVMQVNPVTRISDVMGIAGQHVYYCGNRNDAGRYRS